MTKRERTAGWIYVFIHMFAMPLVIIPCIQVVLYLSGKELSMVYINALYYGVGLLFVLAFMMSFLRQSFMKPWNEGSVPAILIAIGLYFAFGIAANAILMLVTDTAINPNQAAVNESVSMNTPAMIAVAVLMGPVVEEVLFRGVVFGTIREKRPITAYVVSALLFAFYHLWQSAIAAGNASVFVYMIQYIPIGAILAWVYERTGTIWGSIALHMIINTIAVAVSSQAA